MLAEARRKAKQFLLDPDYSPAQTVVEEEVLPAIEKAQQVHGGGSEDQVPLRQQSRRPRGAGKSDGGMRKARAAALSNVRATGKFSKPKRKRG